MCTTNCESLARHQRLLMLMTIELIITKKMKKISGKIELHIYTFK